MNSTNSVTKGRDVLLDIIKGFTIILVVFGHAIEYGEGAEANASGIRYDEVIYKLIYSVHMPLFMLISGYLFYFTVQKRSFKAVFISRFTRFIIPIFAWNGLFLLIRIAIHVATSQPVNFIYEIYNQFDISLYSIWFLWAIFWCSLIVSVIHYFFRDNIYLYTLCYIITFLIPDAYNCSLYSYMYPFFVTAYLFNKNKATILRYIQKYTYKKLFYTTTITYIVLIFFFDRDSFIYTSGYTILGKERALMQAGIDLYRMIIGFVGCTSIILATRALMNKGLLQTVTPLLSKLGYNSLGIYIISLYIDVSLLRLPLYTSNYILLTIESVIVLCISYFLTLFLQHFKTTNKLFLGGK